jgi:hypothetical protein
MMLNFLKDFEEKLDIKITCSQETKPLGTVSPLALARDKLIDGSGEPFFVLNNDVSMWSEMKYLFISFGFLLLLIAILLPCTLYKSVSLRMSDVIIYKVERSVSMQRVGLLFQSCVIFSVYYVQNFLII